MNCECPINILKLLFQLQTLEIRPETSFPWQMPLYLQFCLVLLLQNPIKKIRSLLVWACSSGVWFGVSLQLSPASCRVLESQTISPEMGCRSLCWNNTSTLHQQAGKNNIHWRGERGLDTAVIRVRFVHRSMALKHPWKISASKQDLTWLMFSFCLVGWGYDKRLW